jgi:hypothetical protein
VIFVYKSNRRFIVTPVPKTKQLEKPTSCCGVRLLILIEAIGKYSCPCGETKLDAVKRKRKR